MFKLKKEHLPFLVFWPSVILIFVISAIYLVAVASGYKFNFQAKKVQKTSLLVIKSNPPSAKTFLDGVSTYRATPVTLKYILPGWHNVRVEKESFITWEKAVFLEEGKFLALDDIVLFKEKIKSIELESGDLSLFQKEESFSNLLIKENEIWFKEKLIARFSETIKEAAIYPDQKHIVYQIDKAIKVIDTQGGADTPLVALESPEAAKIQFQDGGEILLLKQGEKLLKYKIR